MRSRSRLVTNRVLGTNSEGFSVSLLHTPFQTTPEELKKKCVEGCCRRSLSLCPWEGESHQHPSILRVSTTSVDRRSDSYFDYVYSTVSVLLTSLTLYLERGGERLPYWNKGITNSVNLNPKDNERRFL